MLTVVVPLVKRSIEIKELPDPDLGVALVEGFPELPGIEVDEFLDDFWFEFHPGSVRYPALLSQRRRWLWRRSQVISPDPVP